MHKEYLFNKILHLINKKQTLLFILFSIFSALAALTIYFIYNAIILNYLPVWSDEYIYTLNAKSFQLYNRIDTVVTIHEAFSAYTSSSPHGFMYSVFYGSLFKVLFFVHIEPSILTVNIILISTVTIFIAYLNIALYKKLLIYIILFSNFVFILYNTSSMTEIFHFMFSVVVAYLLNLIYQTKEKKHIIYYVGLVFLLATFRQSWIFFLFALLPLSKSYKAFIKYSLLILVGILFVIIDIKLFHATYPLGFLYKYTSQFSNHDLFSNIYILWEHFLLNIDKYFCSETYKSHKYVFYWKYLYIFILLSTTYYGIRHKNKLFIGISIVSFVYLFTLFSFYDAYGWREARALAVPFMIMLILLILNNKLFPILIIIFFQLLTYTTVVSNTKKWNLERTNMNVKIINSNTRMNNFLELKKLIIKNNKKATLVLLKKDLIKLNESPIFLNLPIKINQSNMSYSLILRNTFNINHSQANFYISNKLENLNTMKLIHKNKDFYFYKRIQQ